MLGFGKKAKPLIGLDIGSSSIKAVELRSAGRGFRVKAFAFEPLPPDSIVDGAIIDAAAVADALKRLFEQGALQGERGSGLGLWKGIRPRLRLPSLPRNAGVSACFRKPLTSVTPAWQCARVICQLALRWAARCSSSACSTRLERSSKRFSSARPRTWRPSGASPTFSAAADICQMPSRDIGSL